MRKKTIKAPKESQGTSSEVGGKENNKQTKPNQQEMETLYRALSCCKEHFGGVEDVKDKYQSITITTIHGVYRQANNLP